MAHTLSPAAPSVSVRRKDPGSTGVPFPGFLKLHILSGCLLIRCTVKRPPASAVESAGKYHLIDACRKIFLHDRLLGKIPDFVLLQSVSQQNLL